ncbi:MAG: hypothetical protein AABX83_01075 [Nanoarchaeota archaeon]
MKGVKINELEAVNLYDIRGFTYEWMKGGRCEQLTLCYRKADKISGNHYHKGKDISKNPETTLLISGKLKLIMCDGKETIEKIIEKEGTEIIICPDILHTYRAITDVVFLEYRKSIFNPSDSDTFSSETFESYLESKNFFADKEAIKVFNSLSLS